MAGFRRDGHIYYNFSLSHWFVRLYLNRPNVNQILLFPQSVILLISACIEKAPIGTALAAYIQFYSKILSIVDCK